MHVPACTVECAKTLARSLCRKMGLSEGVAEAWKPGGVGVTVASGVDLNVLGLSTSPVKR